MQRPAHGNLPVGLLPDAAYESARCQMKPGDRLIFTNEDDVIHNIHIFGPGGEDDSVDLGLQKPGKTLSYKFDRSGGYRVRCNIHPSVRMSVQVK